MTTSYTSEYGSAARTSRVGARRRVLQGLQLVQPLNPAFGAPQFVLLDARAEHLVVDAKSGATVFVSGAAPRTVERSDRPRFATLTERAFVYGTSAFDWQTWAKVSLDSPLMSEQTQPQVARLEGAFWLNVTRVSSKHPTSQGYAIYSRDITEGAGGGPRDWHLTIANETAAPLVVPAIDAGGRTVLLVNEDEPRLLVLGRERAAESKKPAQVLDLPLSRERYYALSTPLGSIALLSARILEDTHDLTSGTALHEGITSKWRTRVHLLSEQGAERWQAEVPFEALEPAIDGGDGRIYLVGNGLALVEGGNVTWSTRSSARMRATAFASGELALTVGSELRIIGRDGTILQTFKTPNQEPILTPPALSADGAVYVATPSAVFVAH